MVYLLDLPVIGLLVGTILPFLVVLAIVIFVHEYGHYIVGRWCGIHSEEFSLGFGGEIFGWTDRRGTRWRVAWVPLGGYVRFKGDADAASTPDGAAVAELSPEERRRTLPGAPLWARAATVAAGPAANFVLAIAIFAAVVLVDGKLSDEPEIGYVSENGQAAAAGLRPGDRLVSVDGEPVESFSGFLGAMLDVEGLVRSVEIERDGAIEAMSFALNQPPQIGWVDPDGAAARACLRRDDVILKVEDAPIATFSDLQAAVLASNEETVAFDVQRGAELISVDVTPARIDYMDPGTGAVEQRVMIGVVGKDTLGFEPIHAPVGPAEAMTYGLDRVGFIIFGTVGYLSAWVSGQADGSALGGPIGIARMSGQTAQLSVLAFIAFIGTVSVAIGFINLLPIPMLDGGHLVFYALEGIRGKPLGERWMEAFLKVGLAAILVLLLFATYQDLMKWAMGVGVEC